MYKHLVYKQIQKLTSDLGVLKDSEEIIFNLALMFPVLIAKTISARE